MLQHIQNNSCCVSQLPVSWLLLCPPIGIPVLNTCHLVLQLCNMQYAYGSKTFTQPPQAYFCIALQELWPLIWPKPPAQQQWHCILHLKPDLCKVGPCTAHLSACCSILCYAKHCCAFPSSTTITGHVMTCRQESGSKHCSQHWSEETPII